jgi:hypothetical protein
MSPPRQLRLEPDDRLNGRLYFLWHYLKPQLKLWFGPAPVADAMYIRADALAVPAFLWARLRKLPVAWRLTDLTAIAW